MLQSTKKTSSKRHPHSPKCWHLTRPQYTRAKPELLANLYIKCYSNFASCSTIFLFLVQDPVQEPMSIVISWNVFNLVCLVFPHN